MSEEKKTCTAEYTKDGPELEKKFCDCSPLSGGSAEEKKTIFNLFVCVVLSCFVAVLVSWSFTTDTSVFTLKNRMERQERAYMKMIRENATLHKQIAELQRQMNEDAVKTEQRMGRFDSTIRRMQAHMRVIGNAAQDSMMLRAETENMRKGMSVGASKIAEGLAMMNNAIENGLHRDRYQMSDNARKDFLRQYSTYLSESEISEPDSTPQPGRTQDTLAIPVAPESSSLPENPSGGDIFPQYPGK